MKILIGRHNGLGDLVMAFPFVGSYLDQGHEITFACDSNKHAWLAWLFPSLELIDIQGNPFDDRRQVAEGYDIYLNFNRVEVVDGLAAESQYIPINQQFVYSIIAGVRGLPLPQRGLSPSRYVKYKAAERSSKTLLFTKSTHNSRTMDPGLVEEVRRQDPDIVIDPVYADLIEMSKAVAEAREVVGTDSGAVHLAEAMGTPWRVLHTTMDYNIRNHFYIHGSQVTSRQARADCSPCFRHGGCADPVCNRSFTVEEILGRFSERTPLRRIPDAGI